MRLTRFLAGLGKMRIGDQASWEDFLSLAALSSLYFTSEPYIDYEYDLRIQKVERQRPLCLISVNRLVITTAAPDEPTALAGKQTSA
jgi:hypothetical protein